MRGEGRDFLDTRVSSTRLVIIRWMLDAGCWMLDAGCWMLDVDIGYDYEWVCMDTAYGSHGR